MTPRGKNTAGFTLSELLLSVAILLVLAAIAIPSVVTAQNNMRMVELNNAAESLANAAQTQMTAKKVSGTWLGFIEKGGNGADAHEVKFPKALNAPSGTPADTYYLTAEEARAGGIVPSLSIDDQVRDGDYIIEFTASTASVVSVFYTDGKTGFFGSVPEGTTTAAQSYYTASGARDQASRASASPMIGYYQGTPAGATNAVALQNPAIWVDEGTGSLVISDPNIKTNAGATGADTNTIATLASEDGTRQFQITGLSNNTMTIAASLVEENAPSLTFSGTDREKILSQVEGKSTGEVAYAIDLNALARLVDDAASKADPNTPNGKAAQALQSVIGSFAAKERVTVSAQIAHQSKPYVPATARAFIEWPRQVGKLTVLVTNPYSEAVAGKDIEGAANPYLKEEDYAKPNVAAWTTENAKPVNGVASVDVAEDYALKDSAANSALAKQNKQAAYQSYVGGWLPLSTSGDPTLALKATIGSYKSHAYQVHELWITQANGEAMRIGFMRNNAWEWAKVNGTSCSVLERAFLWYNSNNAGATPIQLEGGVIEGKDTGELGIVSLLVKRDEFAQKAQALGLLDAGDNVTLYVRTAPKMSEVQDYFNAKAESGALLQELVNTSGATKDKVGSRGTGAGLETPIREIFEREFGASSSDVSWVVDATTNAGFDQGNQLLDASKARVRIYYSVAPGVGFSNIRGNSNMLNLRSTEMTNVALWLYTGEKNLTAHPGAMVLPYENNLYWCGASSTADFELKTTEDYRFYRVISYYDDDGTTKLDIPLQYVPHITQDAVVAKQADKVVGNDDWVFVGWTTADTRTGEAVSIEAGQAVGDYDNVLSRKGTKLVAVYRVVVKPPPAALGIGLAYVEFSGENGTGDVVGYQGSYVTMDEYSNPKFENFANLPSEKDAPRIGSWGYVVVVPEGDGEPRATSPFGEFSLAALDRSTIELGGKAYSGYRLTGVSQGYFTYTQVKAQRNLQLSVSSGDNQRAYTFDCNLLSAATVDAYGAQWGTPQNPWIVRTADQIYGFRDVDSEMESEFGYHQDFYRQDHDIDMTGAVRHPAKEEFAGTFDGNGHMIANYAPDAGDGETSGLFLEAKKATFKNVAMTVALAASAVEFKNDEGVVGCLVGKAEKSAFENCSVRGVLREPAGAYHLWVADASSKMKEISVGGLVGEAEECTFVNCIVRDLACYIEASGQISAGSLIGQFEGKGANFVPQGTDVLARQVDFTTNTASTKVYVGGVIGFAEKFPWGQESSLTFESVLHNTAAVTDPIGGGKQKALEAVPASQPDAAAGAEGTGTNG